MSYGKNKKGEKYDVPVKYNMLTPHQEKQIREEFKKEYPWLGDTPRDIFCDFFLARFRKMEGEIQNCQKCDKYICECEVEPFQPKEERSEYLYGCCSDCGNMTGGGYLKCMDRNCSCHAPQSKEVIPSQEKACGKFDCSLHNDGYGIPCNDGYMISEDNKEPWWESEFEKLNVIKVRFNEKEPLYGKENYQEKQNIKSFIRSVEERAKAQQKEEIKRMIEGLRKQCPQIEAIKEHKGKLYFMIDIKDMPKAFRILPESALQDLIERI